MNSVINQEIQHAINRHTENICSTLANKYHFDAQEAVAYITNYGINNHNEKYNEKVGVFTNSDDILHLGIIRDSNDDETKPEKKKRGRPKKIVDEVKEDTPKKKRGRPKKENKITIVNDTDDESLPEDKPTTEDVIAASITPNNMQIENQQLLEQEQQAQELQEQEELQYQELQEENISDQEIDVEEWNYKGDKYLKDDNNNIYCAETHKIIGRYCVDDDTIIAS